MSQRSYSVLHIVNDADSGGAQTLIEALAKHRLPNQSISLCVLAGPGRLSSRLEAAVDHVSYLGFDRHSSAMHRLISKLNDVIKALKPDVVHSHLLHSDLGSLLARGTRGAARISTLHTTGMSDADPLRSRVLGTVVGVLSRRFDRVVACDDSCLAYAESKHYPLSRVQVIPNGVELPASVVPAGPEPVLLSLARWHPMKDFANLFQALALLRAQGIPARLRCAGGDMTEDNVELAELLGSTGVSEHVELLGTRSDVGALLDDSSVLVIASAYGEALPMAGLEALAHGRPVVTTDVGGCAALTVTSEHLVPPSDPVRLAEALSLALTASDDQRAAWGQAAREIAEQRFDIASTVRAYDAIYRESLAGRGRSVDIGPTTSAVVCVTAQGGHLEHAFNLASALSEATGEGSWLISRAGAADYLPTPPAGVEIVELEHAFVEAPSLRGKVTRTLREAREVRRILSNGKALRRVLVEEPHMVLALPLRRTPAAITIMHNAKDHDAGHGGLAGRIRASVKLLALLRSRFVVVHGEAQRDALPRAMRRKALVVELPGAGEFEAALSTRPGTESEASGGFLCIGELRRNKNYEEAILATAKSGKRLVIAGADVEDGYGQELKELAASTGADVIFRTEFLAPEEFARLLGSCTAVLLPYSFFVAQSGVLERALAIGTPVLSADLPSLREQAGGRDGVVFYPSGAPQELAELMATYRDSSDRLGVGTSDPRWETLAQLVVKR